MCIFIIYHIKLTVFIDYQNMWVNVSHVFDLIFMYNTVHIKIFFKSIVLDNIISHCLHIDNKKYKSNLQMVFEKISNKKFIMISSKKTTFINSKIDLFFIKTMTIIMITLWFIVSDYRHILKTNLHLFKYIMILYNISNLYPSK